MLQMSGQAQRIDYCSCQVLLYCCGGRLLVQGVRTLKFTFLIKSTPMLAKQIIMNYLKLVIPLHSLYWSVHAKDETKHGMAFAFIFGVN